MSGRFTMDEIAGDTLALADELGWDEFDLVGHSMGGMAAQQVLAAEPRRVRRIVALNGVRANGIPFDEEPWALFSGAADSIDNRRMIIDLTTGNRPVALATSIEDFLG